MVGGTFIATSVTFSDAARTVLCPPVALSMTFTTDLAAPRRVTVARLTYAGTCFASRGANVRSSVVGIRPVR